MASFLPRSLVQCFPLRRLKSMAFMVLSLVLVLPPSSQAQSLFEAVAQVNNGAITRFEVDQRIRFLQVLRRPGVTEELALQELIEDRLKLDAARATGGLPTSEELVVAVDDFAARANLSGEEFLDIISEVGIAPETVSDYLAANLAWADVIRTRFGARSRPSDAEIDRALSLGTGAGSARVLLSEIILPLSPELAAISQERAAALSEITSVAEFANAARQFSASQSRVNGGRLDWIPLSDLPNQIAPLFLTMKPGEVTPPVPIDGGLALFQFRALQDTSPSLTSNTNLDYARLRFPAGTNLGSERASLLGKADTCDDLFGLYFGATPERLERTTAERSSTPAAVTRILDTLDPGEIGIQSPQSATDGGALVMLCSRSIIQNEDLTREDVAQQLFSRRLDSYANGYLSELRAEAHIELK